LHRQPLLERAVEDFVTSPIVEISQQDRVVFRENRLPVEVEVSCDGGDP